MADLVGHPDLGVEVAGAHVVAVLGISERRDGNGEEDRHGEHWRNPHGGVGYRAAMSDQDNASALEQAIARYNEAWNSHDLDAIVSMHAPDMVFENHTAGERAEGEEVREHIGAIFGTWPDIAFTTRRLYVRDGLVVQEWTATATHTNEMRRGDIVAPPSGEVITWKGLDVIPFEDGLVKRKDVYSDSVSILRQLGLLN